MKARCKLCNFEYSITGTPQQAVKHFAGTSNNFCVAEYPKDWEIINDNGVRQLKVTVEFELETDFFEKDIKEAITVLFNGKPMDDIEVTTSQIKNCDTCQYADCDWYDSHCVGCYDIGLEGAIVKGLFPKWTLIESKKETEA